MIGDTGGRIWLSVGPEVMNLGFDGVLGDPIPSLELDYNGRLLGVARGRIWADPGSSEELFWLPAP